MKITIIKKNIFNFFEISYNNNLHKLNLYTSSNGVVTLATSFDPPNK